MMLFWFSKNVPKRTVPFGTLEEEDTNDDSGKSGESGRIKDERRV